MIAFHGDPAVKEKYLARVRAHAEHDEIEKGYYWENGKGCAVGCTIEGNDHTRYETEMGIPVQIAYLEDRLFEGMPNGRAKEFPVRFLSAITPGADLSLVLPKFYVAILTDKTHGVKQYTTGFPACEKAVQAVADLYAKRVAGEDVSEAAENAAEVAAVAAGAAAWAAARAAAWTAAVAAEAAAGAAAWAARDAYYTWMADTLIEILEGTA